MVFSPEVAAGKLQLKENEIEVITNPSLELESIGTYLPKVIYGRILSGKSVNKVGLKKMFESLW